MESTDTSPPIFVKNFLGNQQARILLDKLWEQREAGQFCDIILHVKGERFEAHKNVLAACSPYFESILKSHCTNDELLIICQSLQAFQFLLKFLYTGAITIDETNVSEILVLACHFDLDILKNYCVEYLSECMDVSNCATILEMAIEYGLHNLRKHVEDFVLTNIVEINGHIEFLNADFSKINPFLDSVNTIIPQYILLDFICKWVLHDIKDRAGHFQDLLKIVNWQCVDGKFLENLIHTCPLFQSDAQCLNTLFACLKEKEAGLEQFQNTYRKVSFENSSNTSESKHAVSDEISSETTAGLFNSILGYSESSDTEPDKLITGKLSNEEVDISVADKSDIMQNDKISSINNSDATKNGEINDKIATLVAQPITDDERILISSENHDPKNTFFSEKTGLFIDKSLISEPSEKALNAEKSVSLHPSGNLSVLAEVTEMFSNYNKSNIKLAASKSSTALVKRKAAFIETPAKPTPPVSTKTVDRPAIHYLSKHPPSKEILTNETNAELSQGSLQESSFPPFVPKTEPDFITVDASDYSSNDSYLNEGCFDGGVEFEETCNNNESNISCDIAETEPEKKISLRQKVRLKWKKGVKCNDCSFLAHSSDMMQDHLESFHGRDVLHPCNICDFTCRRRRELTNHMRTHFSGPPFRCDHCEYSSDKFHRVLTHRTIHTGERPFKCAICPYGALTKSALEYHTRSHTGEKPYECKVCHRYFAKKCTLEQHSHSHDTERNFACSKCDFTAKYKSQLIIHQRIHKGFVFRCEFEGCDYSTPAKHCFRAHRRMHINERPYLCGTCGKSFIESGMLVRHERVHMDVKLFFHCDQCEYMTRRRDGLKEHVKKYHSADSKTQYKPRRSNTTSANKIRAPNKKKIKTQEVVSNVPSSETNTITPISVVDQDNVYIEQEVVLVTSGTLNEEQGPLTFLQILPSTEYEMMTVEEVTENI